MQKVLEAIATQVEKPSCPPMPTQKACPATDNEKGGPTDLGKARRGGEALNFILQGHAGL